MTIEHALVEAGVPEEVAATIQRGFDAQEAPPAAYLLRLADRIERASDALVPVTACGRRSGVRA
ncbi:MAG: hypothetical protein JWM87_672 [Candidatus Eremiobacteraeota bacterium]|nr:hypothetical protein [Candidatus Eremiobacteraeota bacterium]